MTRNVLIACSLFAACTGPTTMKDAGPGDSGQPQQFCVASSCNAAGTWRITFAGDAGSALCQPVADQIVLTSDGTSVCMRDATDGGSDGGCAFDFEVPFSRGADVWTIGIPDAGHIYGYWSTQVTGSCSATLSIHGTR